MNRSYGIFDDIAATTTATELVIKLIGRCVLGRRFIAAAAAAVDVKQSESFAE